MSNYLPTPSDHQVVGDLTHHLPHPGLEPLAETLHLAHLINHHQGGVPDGLTVKALQGKLLKLTHPDQHCSKDITLKIVWFI